MANNRLDHEALVRSIAGLGLLGQHWLVGQAQKLYDSLSGMIPPERVATGIPADAASLELCSVVVLDSVERDQCDALILILEEASSRPLLIVLSESDQLPAALSCSLLALGYLLPPVRIGESTGWRIEHSSYDHKKHFDVAGYWQSRYAAGKNSGDGSYGRLARFKARFLNRFVEEQGIATVIELGCGDGAQLGLARYPEYLGLDISSVVIEQCQQLYRYDSSKRFETYDPAHFDTVKFQAELSLSLDVIYHLANDDIYQLYLEHLFSIATRFVVIYSNSDQAEMTGIDQSAAYMRFRDVLADIKCWHPDWSLVSATPNRFPFSALDPSNTSISDFYVFEKTEATQGEGRDYRTIVDRMVLHKILHALGVSDESKHTLGSKLEDGQKSLDRLVRKLDELSRSNINGHGVQNSLEQLVPQINDLSAGIRKGDGATSKILHELADELHVNHKSMMQSLESIEHLLEGLGQDETLASVTRCNELLLQQVDDLGRDLNVERVGHQDAKAECARLERELIEERQQSNETAKRLEQIKSELAHAKQRGIPQIRRQLELSQYAAARTNNDMKSSLTWQAGTCFREASSSWRGMLRFPLALWRVWRKARRQPGLRRQAGPICRLVHKQAVEAWVELHDSPVWIEIALTSKAQLAVTGTVRLKNNKNAVERWGLVRIEYLDDQRRIIPGPYRDAAFSRQVGHYKYLRAIDGEREELFRLRPPAQAMALRLGFQTWQHPDQVEILNEIELHPVESQPTRPLRQWTPPSEAVQKLGILGWPAPPDDDRPLVLAVMDEFTEGCFSADLRLLQPRPDNWFGLAKLYSPVMVLVESSWKGNGGSWQYRVGSYSIRPGEELHDMMAWANEAGVPSVFWNKEDPVHHEKFLEAAALAEHVFTTDENMVESYRRRIGKSSVHALPFAAQPALHKPAPLDGRIARACFAGSWYGDRHAERGKSMKWLLPVALEHGLDIFDRNHGTGSFQFPEEYQESICGSLPYRELCAVYARYRLFLNVNSVTDSPTMLSRRVFELMACGTPVVSTNARALEEIFASDAVWLVRNEKEAKEAINALLNDDAEWRRRSLAGIREVFARHTYAHRINRIFEVTGLSERLLTEPSLLLIAHAEHDCDLDRLMAFAREQSYRHFELLIETHKPADIRNVAECARLVRPGEAGNEIAAQAGQVNAIGHLNCHHHYGKHYLQDLANAMIYQSEAQGWAKSHEGDAFRFDTEAWLTASVWRPQTFMENWVDAEDGIVSNSSLFCTDSDEFHPSSAASGLRV